MKINFWMNDSDRAVALAVGAVPEFIDMEVGELQVGDMITFSEVPMATYQVASRLYISGRKEWQLELVPATAAQARPK